MPDLDPADGPAGAPSPSALPADLPSVGSSVPTGSAVPAVTLPAADAADPDTPHDRPAGAWLATAAAAASSPAWVAAAAATLWWLASQIPQLDAPWPVSDGLSRSDLLALGAVGLDSALTGAPALLVALTGLAVTAARPWRSSALAGLRGAVAVAGGLCLALAVGLSSAAPRPVLLEVPIDAPAAQLQAFRPDAGRLVPDATRWTGRCQNAAGGLQCNLEGLGAQHSFQVSRAGSSGDWRWIASARTPLSADVQLQWLTERAAGAAVAVPLRDRQTVDVALLQRRLTPVVTRTAGPVVLSAAPGQADGWQLLASPALLPNAPRATTMVAGEVALLQLAPRIDWPWWLALLCGGVWAALTLIERSRWRELLAASRTGWSGWAVGLTAAALVAPGLHAAGWLVALHTLAAAGLGLAAAGVWSRTRTAVGSGLGLALAVVWLPLGGWGGPWPVAIDAELLTHAAQAAASHSIHSPVDPRGAASPLLGLFLGAWPLLATACIAWAYARPRQLRFAAGSLALASLVAAGACLIASQGATSGKVTDLAPVVAWGLRGALAVGLLLRTAQSGGGAEVTASPSARLLLLRAIAALAGAVGCVALLPSWLGPLWWRDPEASAWLAFAVAAVAALGAPQRSWRVAALLDAVALAAALAAAGGARLGAAVAGALS